MTEESKPLQLPLRYALVGAGNISRAHLEALGARPDLHTLVAVCDEDIEAARVRAKQAPGDAQVFSDYRELLERIPVDAAVIALPHYLHFPVARDFLAAGVPVLVEKPLTCTLDETRQLQALARAKSVALVTGQNQRFTREVSWLQRWVASDPRNFGGLRSFDIQSWQNILGYVGSGAGWQHWLLDGARAGGGVVISVAVHQLDLVRYITGRDFAEVAAKGRFDSPFYNGAESSATVLLTMDNGATGSLHATYTAPRVPYNEAMTLFGEYGTIVRHATEFGRSSGPFFYASVKDKVTNVWGHQYQDLTPVPLSEVTDLDERTMINQLTHFTRALAGGEIPVNHVDENFNTMACIQAINDSLRSGRPERVATT